MTWNTIRNFKVEYITKNRTFTIQHPFQELLITLDLNKEEVIVSINVLTPPPIEVKEISAELLANKLVEVEKEEREGRYNSELALWLYSLPGKTLVIKDGKVGYVSAGEDVIAFTIHVTLEGILYRIEGSGTYSPEKIIKEGNVITFEGKVLEVMPGWNAIRITYNKLIEKSEALCLFFIFAICYDRNERYKN